MYRVINQNEFPRAEGESWWIVDPNNKFCEFKAPVGAWPVCLKGFNEFAFGTAYQIVANDSHRGTISLLASEDVYELPYYVFARYFDAEAFIRNTWFQTPDLTQSVERFNG